MALPSYVAIRNERKHCTWDFISKAAFVFNKGIIVYLTVQSLCERGRKNLLLVCWRQCLAGTVRPDIVHCIQCRSAARLSSQHSVACVKDVHCNSVLSVGGAAVSEAVTNLRYE